MSLLYILLGCTGSTKAWDTQIPPIVGVANVDDDNQDGKIDWDGDISPEENDLTHFEIPETIFKSIGKKDTLRIRQYDNGFRIYVDGVLKSNSEGDLFDIESMDYSIEFEFESLNTSGGISLILLDRKGNVKAEQDVEVLSAPMLLNHHLLL